MKKLSHVYSYSTVSGIEAHRVIERRRDWIAILSRPDSFCAQSLQISELDAGRYYYTTPVRAAEAFVAKAEAALADPARAEGHDGWRTALAAARSFLCQRPRARTSCLTKGHAK
jgi:hypothetical protein